MRTISVNVAEPAYEELKALAERDGRPVAELLRQSMAEYLERRRRGNVPALDLPPHESGPLRAGWTRAELLDEALER